MIFEKGFWWNIIWKFIISKQNCIAYFDNLSFGLEFLVIPIEKVKVVQSLIPNVKWLALQFITFFLNILGFWGEWCWQLYNPFSIQSQMNCHLDSRDGRGVGWGQAVLSLSLEVLKDEYFHNMLEPKDWF